MKLVKIQLVLLFSALSILFAGCGDPDVAITDTKNYEPKIVVEGYLYANESVHDIKISRNYPIGASVDYNTLYLSPSANSVVVTINNIPLQYNTQTKTFYNKTLMIKCEEKYTLRVSGIIEGKQLSAEAITQVPANGFRLLNDRNLGDINYLADTLNLYYKTSTGAPIYVFTILSKDASPDTYIYENPYESEATRESVAKDLDDMKLQFEIVNNIDPMFSGTLTYTLPYFRTRFYGNYKVVAYAGDENFKNFLMTATDVEEQDGNFHEPIQIFTGDAIGVFASAVRDSLIFNLR